MVQNAVTYTVGYGDYPADVTQKFPVVRLLDGARDALQTSTGANMSHEDSLVLPGAKADDGRAVKMSGPGGVAYSARFYLIGQHLYLLQVAAASDTLATSEGAKLFATFSTTP